MAVLKRVGPPRFIAPGCSAAGLLVRGNIDINDRPIVHLSGGGIATVYSASFHLPPQVLLQKYKIRRARGAEILLVGVWGNALHKNGAAILSHYKQTGQHLGVFDTAGHANAYANCLHNYHARVYGAKA